MDTGVTHGLSTSFCKVLRPDKVPSFSIASHVDKPLKGPSVS